MDQTAEPLDLSVPQSLWESHEPATIYMLRRHPGRLEQIGVEAAEAFFAGSGRLPAAAGVVDLAVMTLEVEDHDDELVLQPRVLLCRRPVDGDGRLDRKLLEEMQQRSEKERADALGWHATEDESAALSGAFEQLAAERAWGDYAPLLDLLGGREDPTPLGGRGG
jgi:hypothetical protein